jgi:hypothetical protein
LNPSSRRSFLISLSLSLSSHTSPLLPPHTLNVAACCECGRRRHFVLSPSPPPRAPFTCKLNPLPTTKLPHLPPLRLVVSSGLCFRCFGCDRWPFWRQSRALRFGRYKTQRLWWCRTRSRLCC